VERIGSLARRYAPEVLIAGAAAASTAEVALRHEGQRPTWFAAPAMALVVLMLLGRHRFPFAAPAASWLLAGVVSFIDGELVVTPVSAFISAMISSFLLGNLSDARRARIGLAIVVCGAAIVVYNEPSHPRGQLVFIPMLFAIVWCGGMALRERAGVAEAAEQRATRAEQEREAAVRVAAAEERALIARELHDTIAHAVSVMVLQVGAVRHKLPDQQTEHKNTLRDVEQTGRTALNDMRLLLDAMRDSGSQDAGPAPQAGLDRLDRLVDEIGRSGVPVQLRITGERFPLPGGLNISAYRIVQESLTNVLKHANAREAVVSLGYAPDELTIEVLDNGQGIAQGNGHRPGHGLIGIRERVRLYSGEMSTSTPEGGGFLVRVRLPLSQPL
jgi:signal transduction histidine kinase